MIAALVGALHVLGWGALLAVVVPQHLRVGATAFGVGIGVTAYVLGLRHALDADHIAAIDNTTRRLMARGERPLSVGFWFSLGHSTIVFALTLLIAIGVRSVPRRLLDSHSGIHGLLSLIGTGVSAGFLFVIAALNIGAFSAIWRLLSRMRDGSYDEASLEAQLNKRGLIGRIVGRASVAIDRPWHMYLVGMLFGLGFDTATEVALLVLAGSGSASGLPWYAILCLPVLFAAGMSLLDTLDGTFMNFAYGWSLAQPVRKAYYNLTVTGLSIAVAVAIGTVELAGLLQERLHLGGSWVILSKLDLNSVGFVVVGLFALTWLVSLAVWRYARIEERSSPRGGELPVRSET